MAFRVLYEGGVTGDLPAALLDLDDEARRHPDAREYASALLDLVGSRGDEIDAALARHSRNWSIERLAATDRLTLDAVSLINLANEIEAGAVTLTEKGMTGVSVMPI